MLTRPTAPRTQRFEHSALDLPTRWSVAIIAAMFVVVVVLRVATFNPNDGVGLLFCLPIAIAAVRFGPLVGTSAGLVGFALFVAWALRGDHGDIGAAGYVSRLVVFLTLGWFVGHIARARAELDARSRLLFNLSPDLMGTLDEQGALVSANEAWIATAARAERATGFTPTATLAEFGDDTVSTFEQQFDMAGDGQRTIEWHVRTDPRRALRYVVGRDVTGRNERADYVRGLLAAAQSARAEERARIASDLHDFVLQELLVARMHLESRIEAGAPAAVDVDGFVRHAITSLRRVIDDVQPLDMRHLTTAAALELAATEAEAGWDIVVQRTIDVDRELDESTRMLAYRLACEALRNAGKHASAQRIELEAHHERGFLELTVRDDGTGLPDAVDVTDALVPAFGTGFNLLLERALTLGSTCHVQSTPGAGTTIELRIPMQGAPSR